MKPKEDTERIEVYIPVRDYNSLPEIQACYDEFEKFKKEINNYKNDERFLHLLDKCEIPNYKRLLSINFEFVNEEDERANEMIEKTGVEPTFYIHDFLILSLTVFSVEDDNEDGFIYLHYANSYLFRLSLFLNISYAFPISFLKAAVFVDGKQIGRTRSYTHSGDFAYEASAIYGWPELQPVNFSDFLDWTNKFDINLSIKSDSAASRAISAYSYLIKDDIHQSETDSLFWIMLGLESIYCVGNSGVAKQLQEKSTIVLGKPKEYKKKLTKLYDFRSRLIHGDMDFTSRHGHDFKGFNEEYTDYSAFALAILLASIRSLITNNIDHLNFKYYWENKKNVQ